MIQNYSDFINELLNAGFSLGGGGNNEGVFTLLPYSWNNEPPDSIIHWHTGDLDTDPWEWRMRVLDERKDIAYGKVFFNKSGYITQDWYPYFLAARRGDISFDEAYEDGILSNYAKRVYDLLRDGDALALHALKQMGEFSREEKSKFDRALVELQMKLFITMCGRQQKVSVKGEQYGWASTMFCTTECFWGDEVFDFAAKISRQEAVEHITQQIYRLNPQADPKKIKRFIGN